MDGKGIKVVAKNSKAYHDYFIEDKYEAGIELAGTEVKSIRQPCQPQRLFLYRERRTDARTRHAHQPL